MVFQKYVFIGKELKQDTFEKISGINEFAILKV
jgi:hypothetical protein